MEGGISWPVLAEAFSVELELWSKLQNSHSSGLFYMVPLSDVVLEPFQGSTFIF